MKVWNLIDHRKEIMSQREKKDLAQQNRGTDEMPSLLIQPSKGLAALNLREIWQYRDLLYFLTWRDTKVRYKQTVLGGLWAIIQPFFTMVVFTLFFGRMAKMP